MTSLSGGNEITFRGESKRTFLAASGSFLGDTLK